MKTSATIMLFPLMVMTLTTMTSCEDIMNRCVEGNGEYASETRDLESFDRIHVYGDFRVQIDTGNMSSVVIVTDENLLDQVVTHVTGNQLVIESHNNNCLQPSHPIEITVNTPSVHEIGLYGSGKIRCYGLETDELAILLEGSGFIDCNLSTGSLTSHIDGSGKITMSGNATNSDLKIIGSGYIQASQVQSAICYAYISGSGRIDARVSDMLDVTIIGSGNVYYWGNPGVLETYISGSGKVIKQ
jgi:hypothetical protein